MKKIFIVLLLLLLGVLYYIFNPLSNNLFPKCPFLLLTGFECPGCGSQRAIHSLLHFDIAAAFEFNALLVLSLPFLALLLYAEFYRNRNPKLYSALHKPRVIWGGFVVVILWWVGRNIL